MFFPLKFVSFIKFQQRLSTNMKNSSSKISKPQIWYHKTQFSGNSICALHRISVEKQAWSTCSLAKFLLFTACLPRLFSDNPLDFNAWCSQMPEVSEVFANLFGGGQPQQQRRKARPANQRRWCQLFKWVTPESWEIHVFVAEENSCVYWVLWITYYSIIHC